MCSYDDRVRPLPPVRAAGGPRRPPGLLSSRPRSLLRRGASRWWGRSAPAEAYGIARDAAGRGDVALSGAPRARPEGVRSLWGAVLDRLEGIGAEVESDHAGAAFFAAAGLHGIHGGDLTGVLAAARRALGAGARLGVAPSRFASHAAALQVRPRRGRNSRVVVAAAVRDFLAPLPSPSSAPARAPGVARGARAARHSHARRARGAPLARGGRALRASRPARARPQPRPRHPARSPAAVRARRRAARPARGRLGPAAGAGAGAP